MTDRAGQQLGNYSVIRLLGKGGFAEVYLGEHIYLKTPAAIKLLQTKVGNKEDLDAFLKEAQTIARLGHPNIVRVMDFGVDGETPFLVMDYAPNGTLRERHPKGTIVPLPTIISYVKQVADALQFAHDMKLIHRDIKPENMLVGSRKEILLSDFGIALIAQSSRYQSTQDVVGTVAYMSPEQIQGKPRPASDQYSLGIVVYEWLTGDRPFHGSFTELCTQHMFAPPSSLHEKVPSISSYVEQVVTTALAKDPKQRFGNIQAFARALEQAIQPGKQAVSTVQPTPSQQPTIVRSSPPTQPVTMPPPQFIAPPAPVHAYPQTSRGPSANGMIPATGQISQQNRATGSHIEPTNVWKIGKRQVRAMLVSLAIFAGLGIVDGVYTSIPYNQQSPALNIILIFISFASLLILPEFFGAVFGPWVGLFAGGINPAVFLFVAESIYRGTLIINYPYYYWPFQLGIAFVGFMSGFAMFIKKGRYNIGPSLGFGSLGIVGGVVLSILATFVRPYGGLYRYSYSTMGLALVIYLVGSLILLPILLVVYHKIFMRTRRT